MTGRCYLKHQAAYVRRIRYSIVLNGFNDGLGGLFWAIVKDNTTPMAISLLY